MANYFAQVTGSGIKGKGCIPFLLKKDRPFSESPIKGKSIKSFHHDILMYLKSHATDEEKAKVENKYQEFSDYLVSKENNKYYVQAIIFDHVISGNDSLSNYSGKELLDLYCYFKNIYIKEASYKEEGIKILRNQFKELVNKETFIGIYNLEYKLEIVRCLNDALDGKYILTNNDIKVFEEVFNSADADLKNLILKVYQECLNVGKGSNLSKDDLRTEFIRLNYLINDPSFEIKYHRNVNLVDMYLITNIQVDDFNNIQNLKLDVQTYKNLLLWFKKQFSSKITYDTSTINLKIITKMMSEPSQKVINNFNNNDFVFYKYKSHNESDLEVTTRVLYDLNEKYGLKVDQYNYLILLESVIWGEIDSYYELAEEYKRLLDKQTHVEVNENPVLTRRVKNED